MSCISEIWGDGRGGLTPAGRVLEVSMVGWAALREEVNESLVFGWIGLHSHVQSQKGWVPVSLGSNMGDVWDKDLGLFF